MSGKTLDEVIDRPEAGEGEIRVPYWLRAEAKLAARKLVQPMEIAGRPLRRGAARPTVAGEGVNKYSSSFGGRRA
jgi:hypothetical protein